MPATVIVGLQWGDEGKGKTTDFLAEQVAMAVRYQGGDNAGHTIVLGDEVFKLHLVPSGVLYPHITCVIGAGVVVNPATLISELDGLTARHIDVSKVRVSRSSHVIMPYHPALDRLSEARLGEEAVGTTHRGIGPAYADRASRIGLRMEDLLDEAVLRHKLTRVLPEKNLLLGTAAEALRFEVEPLVAQALAWGSRLEPHLADTTWLVQDALRRREHVLLEGAQGTLLDIDHGSYPFVTSSSPIAGGACTGGGIGPLQVDEVIGVMKAYATRVGSGPFPTELTDDDRPGHRRPRPRGRDDDRPPPAGRLVRRRAAALRGRGEQRERDHAQQARHPGRPRRDPAVRGLRDRRPARRDLADVGRRRWPGRPRSTRSSRAGARRSTASGRWPTCPRTPGATSPRSRTTPACRSCSSRSGPERTQTIERAWRPMRRSPALTGAGRATGAPA